MKARLLFGVLLAATCSGRLLAQNPIQTYVNDNGKVVFTSTMGSNNPVSAFGSVRLTLLREEMPPSLLPLVETISNSHGVDPNLVSAVMKTESNFNRWAVSSKGARGLMQLIPETGRRFGVIDFFDPQQNIEGAVRYFKFLLQKFDGNLQLSLAAYNAGENLVERLGQIPPIAETREYVRKVNALYKRPGASLVAPAKAAPAPEAPTIYRSVDERGVIHFSNIGPLN